MNDQRHLIFSEQNAHYDSSRYIVLFSGKEGSKIVKCGISKEALEDYFQGNGKNPVKVFQVNHKNIEHKARRKYLAGESEPDGSILLKTKDFG